VYSENISLIRNRRFQILFRENDLVCVFNLKTKYCPVIFLF
jgi:hypothetical protein